MPPNAPRVKTRFTNTAGERVTVMTDGTKTRVPAPGAAPTTPPPTTPPSTDVPVAALENGTNPLNIPQPNLNPAQAMTGAVTGADAILAENERVAQERATAAQTQESETDKRLKELFGIQGQAPQMRQQLEQAQGVDEKQALVNQITAKAGLLRDQRALFDLETPALSFKSQMEAARNDVTKGTFNAMDTRLRMERALESNAKAAELIGLNAQYQMAAGNLKIAQENVNQAMETFYAPITQELEMQKLFFQRNSQRMSDAQKSLADAQTKRAERLITEIDDAKALVSSAVSAGFLSGDELDQILKMEDPAAQYDATQQIIARGIQRQIAEAKAAAAAAAASKGMASPETKNFGTNDAPVWKQWNSQTGQWEDVTGVEQPGASPEEAQKTLDQISFLRDTTARITGGVDPLTGENYEALYEASGANPTVEFLRRNIGSAATNFTRLEAQVDTLKTNALALMSDPNVRKFFGPQMSNADVRLMSSAATTLRPGEQTPEEVKQEALRFDDLLNRMQTAVKKGVAGAAPVQGPVQPINVITAPDGRLVEITD